MERAGNGASGKRCDIDGVTRTGELAGVSESSRDIDGKAGRSIELERIRRAGKPADRRQSSQGRSERARERCESKSQARRVSDFTRSRNDSRGPNILTIGKCPATLPRLRLSVNRPSRPKDQQIFRE